MADDRSWLESLKHHASAPRRAFESLQRPMADYDSPTEYTTASPLVNISRQDIDNATEAAMAVSGGGMSTRSIRAYHSSPHDFDKFDLARIGTGEGAQVYGHGLYFAENPAVSGQGGQYWKQFLRRFKDTPEGAAASRLQIANFDREAAARLTREARDRYTSQPSKYLDDVTVAQRQADLQRQHELLTSGKPVGPRTYEVDIKADPAHMLDWDKPLHRQPRKALDVLGINNPSEYDLADLRNMLRMETSAKDLREAGIPGIKYLDQGSRMPPPDIIEKINAKQQAMALLARTPEKRAAYQAEIDALKASIPQGTSNYVIFDPSILDIVKKYGLAGLAGAPAVAGATRDRDRQ